MGICRKIKYIIFTILAVYIASVIHSLCSVPPLPNLENTWWGPKTSGQEDTSIKPFKINVPDEVLTDLKHRLDSARPFVSPLEGIQQQYGMNTNLLKEIVDFWKTQYNWREREQFLNKYPQFKTNIQGLNIHYIHVKPKATPNVKVVPLLLLHGWPGSVREFYEIIPMLTTPRKDQNFVFELIIPSLPGYGFSDGAVRPGLGAAQVAVVFKNLMSRVGFEKYYVQGGDWGAIIGASLATFYPENVLGLHSNICMSGSPIAMLKLFIGQYFPSFVVDKEHENKLYPLAEKVVQHSLLETGYLHIQASKPDTIGLGLNDSPVGLAAYILEKFTSWTNPEWKTKLDGGLKLKYTYTDLLDNVMIYWITGSITTSVRLYAETINESFQNLISYPVEIPTSCAIFPHELIYSPPSVIKEKYKNLVRATHMPDGGHFAAFEEAGLLADDIWVSIQEFQKIDKATKL